MESLFLIDKNDNVATAVLDVDPGKKTILGEVKSAIEVKEKIMSGHKVAITDIKEGMQIIKYNTNIGIATKDIKKGEHVHLQNMKSNYDERSSKMDLTTGAPKDALYK